MRRILFSPSWLARHLLALTLIGFFLRMGIWQWTKGESDEGTLQNMFYAVEWPIFAAFVIYWWSRMIREDLHPKDAGGPRWGRNGRIAPESSGPKSSTPSDLNEIIRPANGRSGGGDATADTPGDTETEEDRELAAYNRYLASLYERDATRSGRDTEGASR